MCPLRSAGAIRGHINVSVVCKELNTKLSMNMGANVLQTSHKADVTTFKTNDDQQRQTPYLQNLSAFGLLLYTLVQHYPSAVNAQVLLFHLVSASIAQFSVKIKPNTPVCSRD